MSEEIVQFGADDRLHGVLRRGAAPRGAGFLFFNAGVVHRVGAHRLNVKLARALSGPSLRFDLSGLGESPHAGAGAGYEVQASADICAAAEQLKSQTGCGDVIALGMCSGADNSYRAALADPRISGLVLLDPYAYENRNAGVADLVSRATNPDRWARKLKAVFSKNDAADADPVAVEGEQARPVPPRDEFGADLQALTARGVRILIVYTGFVRRFVSRPAHFFETFDAFSFDGNVEIVTMPHTDHTYTELSAQGQLISYVKSWAGRHFPTAGEGSQ